MPAKPLFYLFHGLSLRLLFRKGSDTSNKWINTFKVTKLSMLSIDIQIFFRVSARTFPKTRHPYWWEISYSRKQFMSFSAFRNFFLVVSSDQSRHEAYCPLVSSYGVSQNINNLQGWCSACHLHISPGPSQALRPYRTGVIACLQEALLVRYMGMEGGWAGERKPVIQSTLGLAGIPMAFQLYEHSGFWAAF